MEYDILIKNGMIVTVNPDFEIIGDGMVCISDGKIRRVEPKGEGPFPEAKEEIDANGGIVMPGLVNTHTHLPMTLFRGLADDLPLMEWLNDHIFPAEAKYINPESVMSGALLGCLEMTMSGTTTCCDGYFLEDRVAGAVSASGIRAVLGQGVIDFPAPGVRDPSQNVEHAVSFADKWSDANSRISPSIFCHSPYTCSSETLKKAKQAADSQGLLFQIHAAETEFERDRSVSEHGLSPIKYLDSIGVLDENTLLVHVIWVDGEDIEIIAKRNAKVSVTTESEMKLGSGIAPVPEFLEFGITVGIGTDSVASNNDADLFQEMDFTAKLHKANTRRPEIMPARTVIELATIGGAKAIGLGKITGSLEIGKQADLIVLDIMKPHLVPMYNPASHIVYAASGSDVKDVVVDGKTVMKNREPVFLDALEIMDNVRDWKRTAQSTNT